MDRQAGHAIVEALGAVAANLHRDTGAPVVIVLCMGGLASGTVLLACYGADGPGEIAEALRFVADNADRAEGVFLTGAIKAKA